MRVGPIMIGKMMPVLHQQPMDVEEPVLPRPCATMAATAAEG
jgi:hypothetical protein